MNDGHTCAIIEAPIATPHCPLPRGICMWKHRINGHCMYEDHFADPDHQMTSEEFASLVGLQQLGADIEPIVHRMVLHNLREALKE